MTTNTTPKTMYEAVRTGLDLTPAQVARRSGLTVTRYRVIEYELDQPTGEEYDALVAAFAKRLARR